MAGGRPVPRPNLGNGQTRNLGLGSSPRGLIFCWGAFSPVRLLPHVAVRPFSILPSDRGLPAWGLNSLRRVVWAFSSFEFSYKGDAKAECGWGILGNLKLWPGGSLDRRELFIQGAWDGFGPAAPGGRVFCKGPREKTGPTISGGWELRLVGF